MNATPDTEKTSGSTFVRTHEKLTTELSILNEISQMLSRNLEQNELLRAIEVQVGRIFDTSNFAISLFEEGSDEWALAFANNRGVPDHHAGKRFKVSTGLSGYIIRNRTFLLFRNVRENKEFHQSQGFNVIGEFSLSWMGVPLISADKIVGAMMIQDREIENAYNEQDLSLFKAIASQVASAIDRKRHEEALKASELLIKTLSRQTEQFSLVAASIIAEKEEQEIFDRISRAIVEYSDYRRIIMSFFKDSPPYRDIIGHGGMDEAVISRLRKLDARKEDYLQIFKESHKIGRLSYYTPHSHKHILNRVPTVFGTGPEPESEDAWHPEDTLFVGMNDELGDLIGLIAVDMSKSGKKPTDETVRPLEIFSSLISQIIVFRKVQNELNRHKQHLEVLVDERTKELREEIIERKKAQQEKEKLIASKREMEIAKNIQTSLLPNLDAFKGLHFEISANMTPAEDVGGDYYDLIIAPDNRLWFGIGDVTGHGLISGLIMMMAQVSINTLIRSTPGLSPEDVLIYANQVIQSNIRNGLKVDHHMTINFLVEEKEGFYRYAGAHEIILIYRKKTRTVDRIQTKGMWLGIIPDISKPTRKFAGSFSLDKGDILFLYTDGVIEICNEKREQFDIHRLEQLLLSSADHTAEAIKQRLLSELNQYKYEQLDDITFLIMKKK